MNTLEKMLDKANDSNVKLQAENAALMRERDKLESSYKSETAIVNRVWAALGISTYQQAGGKGLHEIVADTKTRAEKAEADNEALRARVKVLTLALERFHDPEGCGDHCHNSCPQCQATRVLAGE